MLYEKGFDGYEIGILLYEEGFRFREIGVLFYEMGFEFYEMDRWINEKRFGTNIEYRGRLVVWESFVKVLNFDKVVKS